MVTGALAGLDPGELADPRPVAAALRARCARARRCCRRCRWSSTAAGRCTLDAVAADLRLGGGARGRGGWRSADRPVGRSRRGRRRSAARGRAARDDGGARAARARTSRRRRSRGAAAARGGAGRVRCRAGVAGSGCRSGRRRRRCWPGWLRRPGRRGSGRRRGGRWWLVGAGRTRRLRRRRRGSASCTEPDDPRLRGRRLRRGAGLRFGLAARRGRWRRGGAGGGGPAGPGWRLHLSGCDKRCAQPAGRR